MSASSAPTRRPKRSGRSTASTTRKRERMRGVVRNRVAAVIAAATVLAAAMPAAGQLELMTLHGTIYAVDPANRTVTLAGSHGGMQILAVRDSQKLKAVRVGDSVIARYYAAVVLWMRQAGDATSSVATTKTIVTSRYRELPSGAIDSQVTLMAVTITEVDANRGTMTIKNPRGDAETAQVQDQEMLEGVNAGDVVQLAYTRALAVELDRSPAY